MSQFTPITLTGSLSSSAGKQLYAEVDGTGMESQNQLFDAVLSITPKATGDASTRKANEYNGIDVEPGMWVTDTNGDVCLRIKSISQKTQINIGCVLEDVDMLSYRLNSFNSITDGNAIVVFSQNSEGEAVITDTSSFVPGGLDKIQSRFVVNEADDRVKFSHDSAPTVEKGDIVTINGSGNIVKFGTAGGSAIKVGTVIDIIRNGKDIFVKPFNDIIRNYKDPEALTANPGGVYYTDPNNAGEITTVAGGKASYMHLNTAIASSQIAGTAVPTAIDIVILNDITIFDGPGGDSVPADIDAFKTLINSGTSSHNVTATASATPVSIQGGDFEPAYASSDYYSVSDSYVVTGIQGQPPAIGEITISDGVNAAQTILFDNPDDTLSLGDIYDVISPDAMLTKFQAAITAGSLDLVAELVDMTSYDGQTIKISTTGSATGVTLTNVNPAAFSTNVVGTASWTGIGESATVGSPVLTLSRAAGGPIKITGSPITSGYINAGGAVSSNSGRVPFLLLMESEGGGVAETGVNTRVDYNKNPSVTLNDGDTTGLSITYTPFSDSAVVVKVNGLQINLGDGAKDEGAYFSADGGTTAKLIADIVAGDTLYWMGSIATYELETDDDIDIDYAASSNDV